MSDNNYAIIQSGGRQYRVAEGQVLKLGTIPVNEGETVDFDNVLMISNGGDVHLGAPTVANAKVVATVMSHGRDRKVKILKFKRRKHHMKRMGHRQDHTMIKVKSIVVGEESK